MAGIDKLNTAEDEYEGETLDDLRDELDQEEAEAAAQAEKPSAEDEAKARAFAEEMNNAFLWIVNRTQCPHIDIDQVVNREKGVDSLEPLAAQWGGEIPAWLKPFRPYLAAGVYMGATIVTARQAERQALEILKQQQGGEHGQESGAGTD